MRSGQSGLGLLLELSKPATSQAQRGPYRAPVGCSVIRRLRVEAGLTQSQAAKLARVGLRTFQRAESGDVVDVRTKRAIERSLGATW